MGDEKKYPECEKLAAVKDKSQKIGEFLEWLSEKGVELATRHTHTVECVDEHIDPDFGIDELAEEDFVCGYHEDDLALYHVTKEKLLAEFFEIDLNKVEDERQAMIEELRNETH